MLDVINDFNRLIQSQLTQNETFEIEAEQTANDATQDILHVVELTPNTIDITALFAVLSEVRSQRREAKNSLEFIAPLLEWKNTNTVPINKLSEALGQMRKILQRQERESTYVYKTDIICQKGSVLQHISSQCEGQMIIEGWA